MDADEINHMLDLAQMEHLCAKSPFESAIIYALENAKLEDINARLAEMLDVNNCTLSVVKQPDEV